VAEQPPDQVFLEQWRAGDENAARQLFDRYVGRLVALARRHISERLAGRVDAEDIVQSVFRTFFVRVRDGQFRVEGPDDLCKLLARITVHKTLRQVAFHRRARRDKGMEVPQGDGGEAMLLAVCSGEPTAEEVVAFVDTLEHFVTRLGEEDRKILALRLEGHSNAEIAEQLGISDRTVRRFVKRIQEHAEREWPAP
jgi:RNA polymerase sigma-70 factor (ECF subfamily)